MAKQTIREEWRSLNLQINNQFRAAGVVNHKGKIVKPLTELPDSEWKTWILELIKYMDSLTQFI